MLLLVRQGPAVGTWAGIIKFLLNEARGETIGILACQDLKIEICVQIETWIGNTNESLDGMAEWTTWTAMHTMGEMATATMPSGCLMPPSAMRGGTMAGSPTVTGATIEAATTTTGIMGQTDKGIAWLGEVDTMEQIIMTDHTTSTRAGTVIGQMATSITLGTTLADELWRVHL